MTDITREGLYIGRVHNVISTSNRRHHRNLRVASRHSDAFVYIISGSCRYTFSDGREFRAEAGDVLYLAYCADYTMYIESSDYRFIFCDFEFADLSERMSCVYSPEDASYAYGLFKELMKRKGRFADTLSVLYRIYALLCECALERRTEDSVSLKIKKAREYVDEHYRDNELSVSLLSEMAGMSEVYFRALFKRQYHTSPSQYIIEVRLDRARELMNYPFLTLEECARQSGFSSLQYFCRVFKRHTGKTPAEYRAEV